MTLKQKIRCGATIFEHCVRNPSQGRGPLRGLGQCSQGLVGPFAHTSPSSSCRLRRQIANTQQVGGCRCQGETPSDSLHPSEARLALQGDRLPPAENFLHPFAFGLTCLVAGVAGRPSIKGTPAPAGRVLRYLRSGPQVPYRRHKSLGVISLVPTHADRLTSAPALQSSPPLPRARLCRWPASLTSPPPIRCGSPSARAPGKPAWLPAPDPCGTSGPRGRWSIGGCHSSAPPRENSR